MTLEEEKCLRKRHYDTEAEAQAKARELAQEPHRGKLRVYRCGACKRWALTSQSTRPCPPRGKRMR